MRRSIGLPAAIGLLATADSKVGGADKPIGR